MSKEGRSSEKSAKKSAPPSAPLLVKNGLVDGGSYSEEDDHEDAPWQIDGVGVGGVGGFVVGVGGFDSGGGVNDGEATFGDWRSYVGTSILDTWNWNNNRPNQGYLQRIV